MFGSVSVWVELSGRLTVRVHVRAFRFVVGIGQECGLCGVSSGFLSACHLFNLNNR